MTYIGYLVSNLIYWIVATTIMVLLALFDKI